MRVSDFKVTLGLGAGFSLLLVILIIVTFTGLAKINQSQESFEHAVNDLAVKAANLDLMTSMIKDVNIYTRDIILFTSRDEMQEQLKKVLVARNIYDQAESRLDTIFVTEDDKLLVNKIKELRSATRPFLDRAIALGLEDKNQEATDLLMKEVVPRTDERLNMLEQLIKHQNAYAQKAAAEAASAHAYVRILTFCLGGLAFSLFMFVAFIFIRVAVIVDAGKSVEHVVDA